ncbi:MAG TPA: fibronectin type III domain-containing protein [Methanomassiliicoccales archaeon]|nr:fibronectin type III domain-containing protein [Methanomassiliicoccales archaeon]
MLRTFAVVMLLTICLASLGPTVIADEVPGAPMDFAAERDGARIVLSWQPPGEVDVIHYNVYRGTNPDDLAFYDDVDANVTAGYDTEVLRGTTYYYAISANGTAGEGPLSPVVMVTPPTDQYSTLVMSAILIAVIATLLFAYRKGRSPE